MQITENYNLIKLNTFGISARAKFFVEVNNEDDLRALFLLSEFKNNEKLFLGGGSNVLFTKDFDGIVILNRIKGIEIVKEESSSVLIRAMGGEIWNDLVNFAVEREYWGIENLALVPGTVGAAPMQNIGAYGVELKDTLESVEALDIQSGGKKIFLKDECGFGYRESIFKNKIKGQYFISAITLRLSKIPQKNVTYKVLKDYLEKNNIEIKKVKDVADVVSQIRRSKLPDPAVVGNAGSFFKNVFTSKEKFESLLREFPEMPHFEEDGFIKIPAGWLIEQCGWKGKRVGNVGVHDKQALVIVNHGGATGEEIKNLASQIITSVEDKFHLKLIPEVNFV
ncbi:MAG: UDP-N-acetylmuramate dehydrogenase [Candidatus Paceibacterota bacterium]|jgi:UDP-N-acetylmuramate dehydrogenase